MRSNDSRAFHAFVLEAKIFERLYEKPAKFRLFADYLKSIEDAYADVTPDEATAAGKAAGEAKAELGQAYADFFMGLNKRPRAVAIEQAQAAWRDELNEIEGVSELLYEFERLAIGFEQNHRLGAAFCEGYCAVPATQPHSNELLDRQSMLTFFQDMLLALSSKNRTVLLDYSQPYARAEREGIALSVQAANRLNKTERRQFEVFDDHKNMKYNIAERHFFLRGVEIAIQQYCKMPTPGSYSLDDESLFDLERLDRCLVTLQIPCLDESIRAKLGDELVARMEENTSETEDGMQGMALLCGYRLATDLLSEHYPDFRENALFSNLLISTVLSYID